MKKGPPKKGMCRPLTTGERLAVKQGDVKLWILRNTKGDLWIMEGIVEGKSTGVPYGSNEGLGPVLLKDIQLEMLEDLAEYWSAESETYTRWYGFRMTEAQWDHLQILGHCEGGKVSVALRHIIDESMKNWC